jgi:hypothetical protein
MTTPERADEPLEQPARQMRNGSAWLGLAISSVGFLASLFTGWTGALFAAAFGLAFSLTGIVRVRRKWADNGPVALAGIGLALATVALGFVWSARAEPCLPLQRDQARFAQCYQDRAGLL